MNDYPKRGEVYLVNLNPKKGFEQGDERPAVVISNDVGNQYGNVVIIAPITSKKLKKIYPFEVYLEKGEANLDSDSKVMLDQIRTVDKKQRLQKCLGSLSDRKMGQVDAAIRVSLNV